ncbi:cysteine desulfurase DndA [Vibrio neptunius]|uniref:cysteine desulfurase n=2 Tax=Vibrio neptunius TaxID=170651 RepID=A0ABS3A0V8_9VIBR|nr:cysteine desulfurase DndA [Vibrio neptunius]MBN3514725.1 cysteine desulfurase DndA [Vibrio neptunius]MBN3552120.1 cysteine desulfurase DndA [Vibrio neptunius]MBN3576674.1 cysteine desulfurase DndA [Vibrio neptunius]MCH9870338.1 cysteine desulfurase DndA [Vibrio neptunius]
MSMYLDFNATSPVLKEVADLVYDHMIKDYGNAGSRTHEFGNKAKSAVVKARKQVAEIVGADSSEVIFTSGATESNNIAILGLKEFGELENKKHIITTKIEHKAVLEPIEYLIKNGFEVTYLDVGENGIVDPSDLASALREDTLLVSIMHVNNETGSIQPIEELCHILDGRDAYLHVDAAQSFGKLSESLKNSRIDLISASGHKMYVPQGVGALIMRKRGFIRPPLQPITFGGGQEKGLRPGTLAVPLIAGFGLACEIAKNNAEKWRENAKQLKESLLIELDKIGAQYNGDNSSPFVLNFSVPGVNSESLMVALKGVAAVSNGSACTASSYTPSHVLTAMGFDTDRIAGAVRISWGATTESLPVKDIIKKIEQVRL